MDISFEIVLDTNVWIYGLRQAVERPACVQLLARIGLLNVAVPRQVLKELRANLSRHELMQFYDIARKHPEHVFVMWDEVDLALIEKYLDLGCKTGDAAVAAHVEHLGVGILVSENRDFLVEIQGLPFRVLRASELLRELEGRT